MFESRCGVCCNSCERKEKVACKGCLNMKQPFWGGECKVKTCCESKDYNHCGECEEFPCEMLSNMGKDQGFDPTPKIEQCRKWVCEKYYETVTCAEMKEIERKANESGLSYYQMMENAGNSAVKVIINKVNQILGEKTLPKGASEGVSETERKDVDVVIFCGKGNNGGDGYVVARELSVRGMNVTVVMADGNPKTEDSIKNANIVRMRGFTIIDAQKYFNDIPEIIEAADVVVDAIYGTGFHGNLNEIVSECTKLINEKCQSDASSIKKLVFALDIPTGLNGDEGKPDKNSVKADYTIPFHRTKPVHMLKGATPYCGEIVAVSIGID